MKPENSSSKKLEFLRDFEGVVAGTDEAGRGPLAGPVVAAAAVLTREQEEALLKLGLGDSKKLGAGKREALFLAMRELGVVWRAQAGSVNEIAKFNIAVASLRAMGRGVRALPLSVDLVVVDGLFKIPDLSIEQLPLVAADSLVPSVSAASVVAKVLRDRVMIALDRVYPEYGFAKHKGYPTEAHREAVRTFGLSPVHRVAFCKKLTERTFERS
ncbi:MAG: ribonuclease HII [Synergistaceae bacterium]|nr:ribonuclease HII [Synergistaceae bacterium]